MKTVGELFKSEPQNWGLRGDPFLWQDLARIFRPVPLPDSVDILKAMLEGAFVAMTAHPINTCDMFYVERYTHGGMSSGYVDPGFWRQNGFPLLVSRFIAKQGVRADK
ncbi:MAG: hypothetical protein RKR03_20620 [Candidatus Competibacter sp.]|nr:hypothetical protein [Candidatus Competibacter sp.]